MTLCLLLAACAGEAESSTDEPVVVATTSILADVARNVVGDSAEVVVLMPPGADPHEFEPSPQQIEAMNTADLLVTNGLNLEEGLSDAIAGAEAEGATVLSLAGQLDPIEFAGEHGHEGEEEHEGELDPHFWQDPRRMAEAARLIGAEMGDAEDYAGRLENLDAEVEELLAAIPDADRKLVTNHEAFGYFADRYGFEVIGTVIPSGTTLAEPSAAELEELAEEIEHEDVPAIFAENTQPDQLAQALANEVQVEVEVVELFGDALGEEGSGAETYIDMLRTNAQRIAQALG